MAWIMERNIDGAEIGFHQEPELDRWYLAGLNFLTGRPLTAETRQFFPRVVRLSKKKKLTDVTLAAGIAVVSQRFREIVEELEPGVHGFAEVEVLRKDGEPEPGTWFICRVTEHAVTVLPWSASDYDGKWFLSVDGEPLRGLRPYLLPTPSCPAPRSATGTCGST